jgi:tripartite-type tricarboxylate transporter receptor subunit TctC
MIDKFKRLGAEAKFMSAEEFGAFIADENRRLGAVVRASGMKGE